MSSEGKYSANIYIIGFVTSRRFTSKYTTTEAKMRADQLSKIFSCRPLFLILWSLIPTVEHLYYRIYLNILLPLLQLSNIHKFCKAENQLQRLCM